MHLVKTTPKAKKPSLMVECPRCKGREAMQTYIGNAMQAGKMKKGTASWICAACHRNGERVVLG